MNNDFDDELEIEKTKATSRMVFTTTITVILSLILLILCIKYTFYECINRLTQVVYHYVDVDDNNRDEIINLIKEETKDLCNQDKIYYCNSMYKIECSKTDYTVNYTVYCKDEEEKYFYIESNNKLEDYIYMNGKVERR